MVIGLYNMKYLITAWALVKQLLSNSRNSKDYFKESLGFLSQYSLLLKVCPLLMFYKTYLAKETTLS